MKTGIILEIDECFLTLLTPDGQFLRAQNQDHPYQIGQEIQFIPIEEESRKPIPFYRRITSLKGKAMTAAVLAVLIGGASLFPVYKSNQVYAYMSIDDGSSIELAVNKDIQVIGMNPFNKQGKEIVNNIKDWKKQDLATVSSKILNEMKKQGISDGEVVFSSSVKLAKDKNSDQQIKDEITKVKEQAVENEAKLIVVNGTKEEREKAKDLGVTLGQFKQPEPVKKVEKSKTEQSKPAITQESVEEQKENQNQIQPETPLQPIESNQINQPAAWNNNKRYEKENNSNGKSAENNQTKKQNQGNSGTVQSTKKNDQQTNNDNSNKNK